MKSYEARIKEAVNRCMTEIEKITTDFVKGEGMDPEYYGADESAQEIAQRLTEKLKNFTGE